nr:hypothetical protein RVX_3065 [Nitratidesulfovibrio sp. HK-II]
MHRIVPCYFGKVAAQLAVIVRPYLAPRPSGADAGGYPPCTGYC